MENPQSGYARKNLSQGTNTILRILFQLVIKPRSDLFLFVESFHLFIKLQLFVQVKLVLDLKFTAHTGNEIMYVRYVRNGPLHMMWTV
jgi:hypothetical protein